MLIDGKKPITLLVMFLMGASALSSLATAPLLIIGGLDNFVAANVFLIISACCFGISIISWALGLKSIEDKKTRTDADKMFFLLFLITIGLLVTALIMTNL